MPYMDGMGMYQPTVWDSKKNIICGGRSPSKYLYRNYFCQALPEINPSFPTKKTHTKNMYEKTCPFPNCLSFIFPNSPPRKKTSHPFTLTPKTPPLHLSSPPPEKNDVLHQGPCTFTVFLGWTFRNPTWHIRRQADATAKETQLLQVQKMDHFNKNPMDFQTGMRYT